MANWNRTIPSNFDQEWTMSDVELRPQDEAQRRLYANKAVLASFSPYFQILFYSDFLEARSHHANVSANYETMQEILRILYQIDRPHSYTPKMIYELYAAADELDFPMIRKLCEEQLLAIEPCSAINVARALNLTKIQREIMLKMNSEQLLKFFDEGEDDFVAPMKDIATLLRQVQSEAGRKYPCCHLRTMPRLSAYETLFGRRYPGVVSPAVRALFRPADRGNALEE